MLTLVLTKYLYFKVSIVCVNKNVNIKVGGKNASSGIVGCAEGEGI